MRANKRDLQAQATRTALIEAAERLFAERGIENVSLREIGVAAGSENTGVANYYFKSKEGLVLAIYNYRLPQLERRRAELLSEAERTGLDADICALLFAHWLPIYEQKDKSGRHTYAGFLASMVRSNWAWLRQPLSEVYPASDRMKRRLQQLSIVDQSLFEFRFSNVANLVIGAILEIDRCDPTPRDDQTARLLFMDAIQMAAGALRAPRLEEDILYKFSSPASMGGDSADET